MYAVGPETGRLLNILARSLKTPTILEIGTSFGYSSIWLAEAAQASGGRLITMELQDYKSAHAREMAVKAGLAGCIDFRVGDAVQMIGELQGGIDFVLVDLWKDLYVPCLEAFYPKLSAGAIIVADNMTLPGRRGREGIRKGSARHARHHQRAAASGFRDRGQPLRSGLTGRGFDRKVCVPWPDVVPPRPAGASTLIRSQKTAGRSDSRAPR